MKKRRCYIRMAAIVLAMLCLFSLCSCFDYNYNWDLDERTRPDIDLSDLLGATVSETLSEGTGTLSPMPPVETPEPEGYDLIMTVSDDGVSYTVAGAKDKSATEIVIPETYNGLPVTAIEDEAFKGMNKLKNISIPDSVLRVGMDAFEGCYYLEYTGINGHRYLGNDKNPKHVLISCSPSSSILSVNATTLVIADGALSGQEDLEYIHIPESVVTVGAYAISYCPDLTEVYIGSNVQYIGSGAFYGCSALKEIAIPDSVAYIGGDAFGSCTSLEKAVIGNGLEEIKPNTFGQCSALITVNFGNKLIHIDQAAFDSCSSLAEVTLPASLQFIHKDAFSSCSSLKYTEYYDGFYLKTEHNDMFCLMKARENVNVLGLNYNTCIVAYGLLGSLENLEKLAVRNQLNQYGLTTSTDVGRYIQAENNCLFTDYGALTGKTLVMGMNKSELPERDLGIDRIADYAFYGCRNLNISRTPIGVTEIGNYAFFACTGFESIILNSSLEKIGDYAFGECISLKKVTLNNSLQSIGVGAFSGCTKLSNDWVLPDSMMFMGDRAFENCIRLPSIEFNRDIWHLGCDVLMNCDDGIKVSYRGTKEWWKNISNSDNFCTDGSINVYCTDGVVGAVRYTEE